MAVEIIDLSNYRDKSGSRVPEGDYLVQVEDLEVGQTQKGDPMWTVYLRIVGGKHDGDNLIDRLTHTEKALFRVVDFLKGMGVRVERKKMRVDTGRLIGRKVQVSVSDGEPYRGTIRSEINQYTRFVAPESNDSSEIDDLPTSTPEPAESAVEERSEVVGAAEVPETSLDSELDLNNIDI